MCLFRFPFKQLLALVWFPNFMWSCFCVSTPPQWSYNPHTRPACSTKSENVLVTSPLSPRISLTRPNNVLVRGRLTAFHPGPRSADEYACPGPLLPLSTPPRARRRSARTSSCARSPPEACFDSPAVTHSHPCPVRSFFEVMGLVFMYAQPQTKNSRHRRSTAFLQSASRPPIRRIFWFRHGTR